MNKSFFSDIQQDLLEHKDFASEAIFDAFNDIKTDATIVKNRDNYIKSLFKTTGFRKEIPIDNVALSSFFSADESATNKTIGNYNDEEEEKLVEIRFIIHNLLPDFERDIMTLIYDYNKIQEDIGVILGLSQEMVNYYKKRAIHRILHFYHHRKIDVNDMRSCLCKHMSKRQLEAMMLYFFKHNQRMVSKELNISQSAVSARLKQGLKKLKRKSKNDEHILKYYKIFYNLTKQKSLYSSQTRMKLITNVENYAQFDEHNQRISIKTVEDNVKTKTQKSKLKIKGLLRLNKASVKKRIKFNKCKLQTLRMFFKRQS